MRLSWFLLHLKTTKRVDVYHFKFVKTTTIIVRSAAISRLVPPLLFHDYNDFVLSFLLKIIGLYIIKNDPLRSINPLAK